MKRHVRALLLLPVLVALPLEGIYLIQPPLVNAVHRAYPVVALDGEGRILYYDMYRERGGDGAIRSAYVLDAARNPVAILDLGPDASMKGVVLEGAHSYGSPPLAFGRPCFLRGYRLKYDRHPRQPPLERLAAQLQSMEAARRDITMTPGQPGGTITSSLAPDLHSMRGVWMPVEWRAESSRLVCRERPAGRVLAGIGPDGFGTGGEAAEGERFGQIDVGPVNLRTGSEMEWLLLDGEGRRLHVLSIPTGPSQTKIPADSAEIVAVACDTRPLRPLAAGAGPMAMPLVWGDKRRVLIFLADGSVVAEFDREPYEYVLSVSGALRIFEEGSFAFSPRRPNVDVVGVETGLLAVRPDEQRRRMRLFRPDQPVVVREVVLTPTRATEVFLANLTASLALLRPLPLVVASARSPLPAGRRWWWRDPWLAAGSYPGWLALSLALAAFVAWRARRAARERCATVRAVRLWTAAVFLLGPVGLLWMRLVLPRVPVESVGGARRAVNLDASPSSSTPWPDPEPLGIEVIS